MLGARAWVEALQDPEWPAWWAEMYACAMDFWLTLAYLKPGEDEWNAYNLYQGRNTRYRFGSLQGAHRRAWHDCGGMRKPLVSAQGLGGRDQDHGATRRAEVWLGALVCVRRAARSVGGGHSCQPQPRGARLGAPSVGVAYREIQRVEWYCQQFGAVVPYVLG